MEKKPEETLSDIRQLMERSSRFHLLSGFSLVSAGICGLAGIWWATRVLEKAPGTAYTSSPVGGSSSGPALTDQLITIAFCTLVAALLSAYLFTWLKVRRKNLPLWDVVVRKVTLHFAIPLVTGGIFAAGMIYRHQYHFIAADCLFFYGLALLNASHYTLKEIRYLGMLEILCGILCLFSGYSLLSLTLGFGILNIWIGLHIWYRHRN